MCPRLRKVGAVRDMISRQDTVANTGFNFRNYCPDWGSLGLQSTQVPSGPEFL